jgi:hypothetical protein
VLSSQKLAALVLAVPIQAADDPAPRSLLEAVPSSAQVVLIVDDFPTLWRNAKASAWADVLRAPEFAPLWARIVEPFEEAVLPLPELPADELFGGLGSVLFYLDGLGRDMDSGGIVVRLGPDSAPLRAALRKSITALPERSTHEGLELYALEGFSEDTAIFEWRDGFAMTGSGASREDTLRCVSELARRLEHGEPDSSFAVRLGERRTTAPGAFELYVDLRSLTADERPTTNESEKRLWEAFGLDGLGWAGLRASLGEGVQSEVLGWIDVPSKGLLARWAACARPAPVELARFAPANAVEVAVFGFDATSAWRALRAELTATYPDADKKLQQGLDAGEAALGIDLERDAIEQLTGEFAEILVPVQIPEGDPFAWGIAVTPMMLAFSGIPGSSPGSAMVVGLRATEPVEHLFEKMVEVSGSGEEMEDEQVGEHWMTTLAAKGVPWQPSWAFVDGALIVSLHAEPVRALLRQTNEDAPPSWLEAEGHRKALGDFEPAFASTLAGMGPWLEAEIAAPFDSVAHLLAQIAGADGGGEPTQETQIAAEMLALAKALPSLIEQHLHGALRTVVWIEGDSLRSRFWSR